MGVTLVSPLSPDECRRRILAAVGDSGLAPDAVIGSARGDWVFLSKRQKGRNSFHTILKAKIEPDATGARLECSARVPLFGIVFSIFWFGGIAQFMYQDLTANPQKLGNFWGGMFMMAAGLGVILFCMLMAGDEKGFLTRFLATATDAQAADGSPLE